MPMTAARWMAVGKTSLLRLAGVDVVVRVHRAVVPSRSVASVASTSLTFMFEQVPEPVWYTSTGNWSSHCPSTTSAAAAGDGLGDVPVDRLQAGVDLGRRALDGGQGDDQVRVDGQARDREVLDRPLGLGRPLGRGRDADLAHRVVLDPVVRHWSSPWAGRYATVPRFRIPGARSCTARRSRPSQYGARSLNFWSLPVAVRASSSRNSMVVGHLVVGQPVAAPRPELVLAGRLARRQHDQRLDRLAPLLVGHADDGHLGHRRVREQARPPPRSTRRSRRR